VQQAARAAVSPERNVARGVEVRQHGAMPRKTAKRKTAKRSTTRKPRAATKRKAPARKRKAAARRPARTARRPSATQQMLDREALETPQLADLAADQYDGLESR
jgi:hypothetical protein